MSPTDTMYCTPSLSLMYPAGMEKFCAVSSWLTVDMDSCPPTSVCSSMVLYASLIWARPSSIWVMASFSCMSASVIWVRPSISVTSRSDTSPSSWARRLPSFSFFISSPIRLFRVFRRSFSCFSVPSGSVMKPPMRSSVSRPFSLSYSSFSFS